MGSVVSITFSLKREYNLVRCVAGNGYAPLTQFPFPPKRKVNLDSKVWLALLHDPSQFPFRRGGRSINPRIMRFSLYL